MLSHRQIQTVWDCEQSVCKLMDVEAYEELGMGHFVWHPQIRSWFPHVDPDMETPKVRVRGMRGGLSDVRHAGVSIACQPNAAVPAFAQGCHCCHDCHCWR